MGNPTPIEPRCIECGRLAVLTAGRKVYPLKAKLWDRLFFVCTCGARVGVHKGTTIPLGYPCGPDTARARDLAHRAFDPRWRSEIDRTGCRRSAARGAAYRWLAGRLGIAPADCHISWFDQATCERVIEICTAEGLAE